MSARDPHSDIDIVDAYIAHGSCVKAAQSLNMAPQTVHRRLVKLGAIRNVRRFSDAEKARLIDYYTNTPPATFSLDNLAAELGRTKPYLCTKAKQLGLTNQSRKLRADLVEYMRGKPLWDDRPHPRGASGMKHTPESLEKISQASKVSWATAKTFGIGLMSEQTRQRRSDAMSANMATRPSENAYSRARGGRRSDIGDMYFRSAWEANYARYLNWLEARGDIERWEYEPETFWFLSIKRGVRSYKPDFRVWEKGASYLVEVKGWMDPKSKTKLKRMKKYYPHERVDVVGAKQYADLKSKLSRIIPGWEAA